jgi:hypothetical protein
MKKRAAITKTRSRPKKRQCSRTFCGIRFTHVEPGLWKSEDGIELMKGNILTHWDRWSVEHNPRVPERWSSGLPKDTPHGLRSTGYTAVEALRNAGLCGDSVHGGNEKV